ncbi:sensor histidine kinase [Desulfoferrobacter suflitae]|uniref:sensor histidine kinase n=1 Tax=Desulfoferrobacter suflitae TaxID=2865782 RepID=UPI002164BF05|nr:PAS domain-containing sensor histidine kinase [Desulfoferrobacter suflitae]MCK8602568.1 PAS domain-containing sensor histidine kinase [Desulfoferrobacter suflitae]
MEPGERVQHVKEKSRILGDLIHDFLQCPAATGAHEMGLQMACLDLLRALGPGNGYQEHSNRSVSQKAVSEAERMRLAHDELDARIRKQNEALAKANRDLRAEINERKKAEKKIRQQNEFLNHVLESLPHPFYVLDAKDYTIKMANSAAIAGELSENTTCYQLTHGRSTPCNGSQHICPLQMVKNTKKPVIVEHIHFDRKGNPRNVEVHGYPIFDEDGNVAQLIEYSLDITQRKKMEAELRNNAEKIKMFAYAISHDLRSPLIGIHGLVELMHKQYRDLLDERGSKYCEQILKASKQVVALVEELNTFIRTKETPLNFEAVDSNEIFTAMREEFSPLLAIHHITWSQPADAPTVKADKLSLLRIFRNLVDNALKYGGDDLSEITIGYQESADSHIFSVSDDGVGIKSEDCKSVFGPFKRNETSKGIAGTGLGLAIVEEIVTRHRGKVWAEPNPDQGVTFYVSLPKAL